MNRRNSCTTSDILRRFIQQAESYNRCMFPQISSTPIPNRIHSNLLDLSSSSSIKKNTIDDVLLADVHSDGYQYETSSLEFNSIQSCCLISIVSPQAFSIQLRRNLPDCDAFFISMNDFYNSIDDLHIPAEYLRRNLLCVTWDEKSSTWNRSQVMEFDLIDDTVNVFFVDLNYWEEHISRSRIRFILTKYSSRPVDLLTCCLASIRPMNDEEKWNDVAIKTFRNVTENYSCDVELLDRTNDGTFIVNLFALHDETYVCVNEFLLHCQMARSIDHRIEKKRDENIVSMHPIISLYWKAGELMHQNVKQIDRGQPTMSSSLRRTNQISLLAKAIPIDTQRKIIFAKYHSYIMLPWFTISSFIPQTDEKIIKDLAELFGFKPIIIDPLSDPLLCSQLFKLKLSRKISTRMTLYSIDCARKLLEKYANVSPMIFELFQRARFAEATDDQTFWQLNNIFD